MHRFLIWLSGWLRVRFIDVDGKPYLERYLILQLFGYGVFLHRFVSQDGERHLHDHPWAWSVGIPICGGYIEERFTRFDSRIGICTEPRSVGLLSFNWLGVNSLHRIASVRRNTWTLFAHSRRVKHWGFVEQLSFDEQSFHLRYSQPLPVSASDDHLRQCPRARTVRLQEASS